MSGFELDQEETLVQQNTLAQQEKPAEVAGLKIALGIEYNGSRYFGWQRQQEVASVQACLEAALSKVANEPIGVFCAGRTDAGVHATGQVVHFVTSAVRKDAAWTMGSTAICPRISQCVGSKPSITIFMPALAQRPAAIAISFLATAIALRYWRKGSPIAICHWMQKKWNAPRNVYSAKMILPLSVPYNVNPARHGEM